MDSNLQKFRILDIDDLMVLKMLGEGRSNKEIRLVLGVTPPAISHRLRKYMSIWDGFSVSKPILLNTRRILSDEAQKLAEMATKVLDALTSESTTTSLETF